MIWAGSWFMKVLEVLSGIRKKRMTVPAGGVPMVVHAPWQEPSTDLLRNPCKSLRVRLHRDEPEGMYGDGWGPVIRQHREGDQGLVMEKGEIFPAVSPMAG